MQPILHDACRSSIDFSHETLMGRSSRLSYLSGMDSTKEEIGRRLEDARNRLNLSRRAVTEKIPGLRESTLSEWEKGRNMANIDYVKQLAVLYGVTAGYLLTLEDAPQTTLEANVMYLLRQTDHRGQESVLRVAEAESAYAGRREDEAERPEPDARCG